MKVKVNKKGEIVVRIPKKDILELAAGVWDENEYPSKFPGIEDKKYFVGRCAAVLACDHNGDGDICDTFLWGVLGDDIMTLLGREDDDEED